MGGMLSTRKNAQFTIRIETAEGDSMTLGTAVGGKWLDKSLNDGLIALALQECFKRNPSLPRVTAQQCSIMIDFTRADGRQLISSYEGREVDLLLSFPGVRAGSYVPPVIPSVASALYHLERAALTSSLETALCQFRTLGSTRLRRRSRACVCINCTRVQ